MDDQPYSASDSDSCSPAFPSLSCNFDAIVAQVSPQTLTMKETDARLDELRRENLNLKLKLYFLEKQKGSVLSLNSGSSYIGSTHSIPQLQRGKRKEIEIEIKLMFVFHFVMSSRVRRY
jgi:hypothetical protein